MAGVCQISQTGDKRASLTGIAHLPGDVMWMEDIHSESFTDPS